MNSTELINRPDIAADPKSAKTYNQFAALLIELKKKNLPNNIIAAINDAVEKINTSTLTGAAFNKLIKQQQTAILKQTEKELKIVPKNYYRNLWMLLGFTSFGLPIGVAFGLMMGNIGLLGVGLPFGMGIGALVGSAMDKKAFNEGRQLDIEIK